MDDVMAVIAQRPATVREPQHPVALSVLAGQQARAACRAGRRGAERLSEPDDPNAHRWRVRHRYLRAVGLDVASGVVRVQIEDVRSSRHAFPTNMIGWMSYRLRAR